MSKKLLAIILPSILITGFLAMNVQAHEGESGKHYVVDSSGNPVKSSSGCVTSTGSGGKHSDACGDGGKAMAKTEMAPAPVAAPAIDHQVQHVVVPKPAPVMMKPAGASHSHSANHCTNSVLHTHAAPGGHRHHYSCKGNQRKMASPRQMAAPRQKAYY